METEPIDVKVSSKRETLDELKDGEPNDAPNENEENEKDDTEKAEEEEEEKKLPKYSPGIPVGMS